MPGSDTLVIVTGMTGAGRSTAAKALEDAGWFVIDNLPPQLLASALDLIQREEPEPIPTAVVVDVRSRGFFAELSGALDEMPRAGLRPRVLFLEASDDVLVRRQEAARRPHPLQGGSRLLDGIRRERELMRQLRGDADVLIDTSDLNVHELASKVTAAFPVAGQPAMQVTVVSFGFKYGIPVDADMVVDMRFLPNPHWVAELRPLTGLDPTVRDYVLSEPPAAEFLKRLDELLDTVVTGFERERKSYLNLAVGCTGGKHRSVVMAEEVGSRLREHGLETLVVHRDLGRE
ncbi:MAG TPA: RNase adapter RapZ [Nocardioidaceae bacterium]|nr:RNase adapter RapZ [Nocardioidaceae bacterium]